MSSELDTHACTVEINTLCKTIHSLETKVHMHDEIVRNLRAELHIAVMQRDKYKEEAEKYYEDIKGKEALIKDMRFEQSEEIDKVERRYQITKHTLDELEKERVELLANATLSTDLEKKLNFTMELLTQEQNKVKEWLSKHDKLKEKINHSEELIKKLNTTKTSLNQFTRENSLLKSRMHDLQRQLQEQKIKSNKKGVLVSAPIELNTADSNVQQYQVDDHEDSISMRKSTVRNASKKLKKAITKKNPSVNDMTEKVPIENSQQMEQMMYKSTEEQNISTVEMHDKFDKYDKRDEYDEYDMLDAYNHVEEDTHDTFNNYDHDEFDERDEFDEPNDFDELDAQDEIHDYAQLEDSHGYNLYDELDEYDEAFIHDDTIHDDTIRDKLGSNAKFVDDKHWSDEQIISELVPLFPEYIHHSNQISKINLSSEEIHGAVVNFAEDTVQFIHSSEDMENILKDKNNTLNSFTRFSLGITPFTETGTLVHNLRTNIQRDERAALYRAQTRMRKLKLLSEKKQKIREIFRNPQLSY